MTRRERLHFYVKPTLRERLEPVAEIVIFVFMIGGFLFVAFFATYEP